MEPPRLGRGLSDRTAAFEIAGLGKSRTTATITVEDYVAFFYQYFGSQTTLSSLSGHKQPCPLLMRMSNAAAGGYFMGRESGWDTSTIGTALTTMC